MSSIKSPMQLIEEARAETRCMAAADAIDSYASEGNPLLLDVREPPEMARGMLPGAIAAPRGMLEMEVVKVCDEPDRPIYVHCGTGMRAILAARTLQQMGYANVTAIIGEFDELARLMAARQGE